MNFFKKKILTYANRRLLWTIVLTLTCAYVYFGHKYKFVYVLGSSMEPTYEHSEILLTERVKGPYKPERYDIVIIDDLIGEDNITKRVLGLPHEKLELIEGKIYINDKALDDPYYKSKWFHEEKIYHIPSDCVWVIGDNRRESHYGIYLIKEIKGLVK